MQKKNIMNSSAKYTFPLFESVCVLEGIILNATHHLMRFEVSYQAYYHKKPTFKLFDQIKIPKTFQHGKVKLRISYNQTQKKYTFEQYQKKKIETLKMVYADAIDYNLKRENRNQINTLYQKKENHDDILIVKKKWLTDTSYANIILWDGYAWYTPDTPLLLGTKRMKLLQEKNISEVPIHVQNLNEFKGFQLINALLDFNPNTFIPIQNIVV